MNHTHGLGKNPGSLIKLSNLSLAPSLTHYSIQISQATACILGSHTQHLLCVQAVGDCVLQLV